MNILAFETATPSGGVALLVDGRVIGEMRIYGAQSHSRHCLAFAETLLQSAQMNWKDLDVVAASHGPGSFTGVRIGLTQVKALAWANDLKCVTVSTLEGLAHHCYSGEKVDHVAAILDARMGEVYGAVFDVREGGLHRATEDLCVAPEGMCKRLPGSMLLSGEGLQTYADLFTDGRFKKARPDRLLASAASVAMLAGREAAAGRFTTAEEIAAVYLRDATPGKPPRPVVG